MGPAAETSRGATEPELQGILSTLDYQHRLYKGCDAKLITWSERSDGNELRRCWGQPPWMPVFACFAAALNWILYLPLSFHSKVHYTSGEAKFSCRPVYCIEGTIQQHLQINQVLYHLRLVLIKILLNTQAHICSSFYCLRAGGSHASHPGRRNKNETTASPSAWLHTYCLLCAFTIAQTQLLITK